ncbi:hypothetical protein D9M69_689730 [compost metagenome]
MVKYTGRPGFTRVTSASEICALTVMVSTWATLMMVGALWIELTVCPSLVTTATTTPSMGDAMRV